MSLPEIKIINHHHLCFEENEYIGRGSPLGNPFSHKEGTKAAVVVESREKAIEMYAKYLMEQIQNGNDAVIEELNRLAYIAITKGKLTLRCYCAPKPCHGDVIRKVLLEAIQENQDDRQI